MVLFVVVICVFCGCFGVDLIFLVIGRLRVMMNIFVVVKVLGLLMKMVCYYVDVDLVFVLV